MVNRKNMMKEQVLHAVNNGEFDNDVIGSKELVVVVMTQDWCPQWLNMRKWIYTVETEKEVDIYELIYNKSDYKNEFMSHKEEKWKNDQIPYLRYYMEGKLFKESNYINIEQFSSILSV